MNSMTVREALRRASSFMESLEDNRFLAEIMIRHVLNWDRTQFFLGMEETITERQWAEVESLVKIRVQGTPIQYLTGEQEFYGLTFKVNPSVLIPRPETEILVEEVLRRRNPQARLSVADIGTGSGAIAVTLAVHSTWKMYAVDIAQESLDTARKNSEVHGVVDRISFLKGDLLSPLPEPVDILVSNPPYIPTQDVLELDVQVKDHEPMRALDGGMDGLDFYRRICDGLSGVLRWEGLVAFEVGMGQAQEVEKLLQESGMIARTEIIKDLAGIQRIVIGEGKRSLQS
ncbi:peptide chain release factor N(5)-glutamine methyltransferase [Ammoniphilus sp. CFH 90114]|uniref:peptide chain release factor N(5)-glutamine methyltransferase n=1 Tax=Ammoniphilus sp. CFH 90114 TaxID=2493665 RepID=UPI00100FC503|nr:peptide chain release factor N(5)-glutamine methyltransferase [Ammoniphilus sp. CFH 90114]RXT08693.1 peptide chain release factor N(5)-glutamine methyltransferase [Ammoniphilus sp. CFH 90114]